MRHSLSLSLSLSLCAHVFAHQVNEIVLQLLFERMKGA